MSAAPLPEPSPAAGGRDRGAPAPALESRRVAELDGLRGVAVLLVIVFHYVSSVLPRRGELSGARAALSWTWSGVDLFFVLSGFLIGGILIENRGSPRYYRTFYRRRACRIVPVYLLVVAAAFSFPALAARGLAPPVPFRTLLPAWTYLTFTQNIFMSYYNGFGSQFLLATWSLAVEEQFYLVMPLVVRLVPPRRLPWVLMAGIAAAPVLRLWFDLQETGTAPLSVYLLMPSRADALLLGVLAAWAWRYDAFRAFVRDAGAWMLLPVGLSAAAVAVLAHGDADPIAPGVAHGGLSWLAVGYVFVLLLAVSQARVARVLRWRALGLLGLVSYTAYLVHFPVLRIVHFVLRGDSPSLAGPAAQAATGAALVVTLALAALSWVVLEKPILRWAHRVPY